MSGVGHTAEKDAGCWRHDYGHREYVCTCTPPVVGDTGREEASVTSPGVGA